MTTVERSIEINAPRKAVIAYQADPANVLRDDNIYRFEADESWPAAGGTATIGFKTMAFNVEGTTTVTEYDPESGLFAWRLDADGFEPSHWRDTLEEHGDRTTLTRYVEYELPGSVLGQVLDRLVVERQNAKQMENGLEQIKKGIEEMQRA